MIFFTSIGLVSLVGTITMDRRKAQEEHFDSFAAATSNVPFAAIIGGRTTANVTEWILPIVIGLVAWAAILWLHPYFTGVALLG